MKSSTYILTTLIFLCMAILVNADLVTIGTATYDDVSGAADYKLIWDDDNNGNSVVWLDYTNYDTWQELMDWATELDGSLTYNIDPLYRPVIFHFA